MNLGEIRAEILSLIEDTSFDSNRLNRFINQTYKEIAARKDIPDLKSFGTVVTNANAPMVNLPQKSNGKVTHISNSDTSAAFISIEDGGVEELVKDYGDLNTTSGAIVKVAIEGKILWYAKIPPTPQTLLIVHYLDPDELKAEGDVPSILPAALHTKLLVNGSARLVFEEIEQDIEGEKAETIRQEVLFEDGLRLFGEWIEARKPHMRRKGNFWNA